MTVYIFFISSSTHAQENKQVLLCWVPSSLLNTSFTTMGLSLMSLGKAWITSFCSIKSRYQYKCSLQRALLTFNQAVHIFYLGVDMINMLKLINTNNTVIHLFIFHIRKGIKYKTSNLQFRPGFQLYSSYNYSFYTQKVYKIIKGVNVIDTCLLWHDLMKRCH